MVTHGTEPRQGRGMKPSQEMYDRIVASPCKANKCGQKHKHGIIFQYAWANKQLISTIARTWLWPFLLCDVDLTNEANPLKAMFDYESH